MLFRLISLPSVYPNFYNDSKNDYKNFIYLRLRLRRLRVALRDLRPFLLARLVRLTVLFFADLPRLRRRLRPPTNPAFAAHPAIIY